MAQVQSESRIEKPKLLEIVAARETAGLEMCRILAELAGTYVEPMRKQGAIILGTGGDNSNGAEGNFYEGIMATGVTSSATDDAIQANIVAVGYKTVAPLVEAQAVL